MPLDEVRISPLDRGFLFGEGLYEVIPAYDGRLVGWSLHMDRLWQGLEALRIPLECSRDDLKQWCITLLSHYSEGELGIYIQITRGAEPRRFHGWKNSAEPTVFIMANPFPAIEKPDISNVLPLRVGLEYDRRWRNCHIKSTSLLGNVLHFQQAQEMDNNEMLLLSEDGHVTEASISNVFIVKDKTIITPPLSSRLLPGVTRKIMLSILRDYSDFNVQETEIHQDELLSADEVWLSSSSKGVAPVIQVNEHIIGDGKPGSAWLDAASLYFQHRFDY